jgi:lactate dehydrogenase-like 2-hydroxyacid dehydrogenase
MGTIGGAIARRAEAMGMSVAYTSRSAKPMLAYAFEPSLVALAAASDILIVCCPATPDTFHLVDADILRALGSDSYLVNIARGSVVDEAALVTALQSGTIAGAGLDVFEDEPHPLPALLALDNVVLTPHMGSGTVETRAAMGQHMIDSLRAHFLKAS